MHKVEKWIENFSSTKAAVYFIIIYIVGLSLSYFELSQPVFQFLIPVNILFSIGVMLLFHQGNKKKALMMLMLVAIISFFVEGYGVNTGIIFGAYIYETALGIKWWNTPLMIGVNWFLLVYCSNVITRKWTKNWLLNALFAASLMLAYDWVLEPVAIHFHFWNWLGGPVPFQNYLAWFVIAFLFQLLFWLFKFQPQNRIAGAIFYIQFGFFVLLHIIHRIPWCV